MPKNDGTMSQVEQKYAKERIEKLLNSSLATLREKYTTPGKCPDDDELWDYILSGKAKLNRRLELKSCRRWENGRSIEVPQLPSMETAFGLSRFFTREKVDYKKLDPRRDMLREAATAAVDEIMLGDGSKAMKAIAEFVKVCERVL
jgi:hypothetical protein